MNEKYQRLIDELTPDSIVEIMGKLGVSPITETDSYIIFPTVCHHADESNASPKLYYYKNNHFFYCYTECGGMSVFRFLQRFYEVREISYDWYNDIYKLLEDHTVSPFGFAPQEKINPRERYQKRGTPTLQEYPETVLDSFVHYYPKEWLSDGISKAAMVKHNILYSISQNKIVIPHYDVVGRLIGIRGRALDPWEVESVGKYMPVCVEGVWYKHPLGLNLYGLDKTKDNIRKTGYAFVCEAEKAVLQMESFARPNCGVAVCGSNFSQFQLNLLMQNCHPKEIVICFDKEELPYHRDYFAKLTKLCRKYHNYCKFSFIYDRDNLLDLKQSPTDRGEEVFEQLLERRIHIK